MKDDRSARLQALTKSMNEFKKENPNINKALNAYSKSLSIKQQAYIASKYKTSTSTKLSSIFTSK